MASPKKAQFVEIPSRVLPYWGFSAVRAALDAHERGQLNQSALLAEAMDRDERIKSALDTRIQGLLGLPRVIEAADDSEQASDVAALVEDNWDKWLRSGDLAQLYRWALTVGVGIGEIVWETDDSGSWTPRLHVWHPSHIYWRWDLNDWQGGWTLTTRDGPIEPQAGDGKWILVTPGGSRRPWMSGLLRSLAVPYLMRGFALRDWGRWSETYGSGVKKAYVPSEGDADDKHEFFSSLQSLGSNGLVVLPRSGDGQTDFDLEMLTIQSESWDGFQGLVTQADTSIAVSVLGQNLTTQVEGGSFAAASVHDGVRQDLMESDAAVLTGAIREQILRPWAAYNFGSEDLAPVVTYDADPPEDLLKKAQTHLALAQAIQAMKAVGANVDVDALLTQAEVPLLDGPLLDVPPDVDFDPQTETKIELKAPLGVKRTQAWRERLASSGTKAGAKAIRTTAQRIMNAAKSVPPLPDGTPDRDAIMRRVKDEVAKLDSRTYQTVVARTNLIARLGGMLASRTS